ncbi:MAG: hypothetical protein ACOX52_17695 [Verrucomicrobiota bacterium]
MSGWVRAWGWQSPEDAQKHGDIVNVQERPQGSSPVPDGLDWDLWIGPAPYRPFHEVYFPGPKWYRWWDFANGTMSDLGSHWIDLPFWALDLDAPRTIEGGRTAGASGDCTGIDVGAVHLRSARRSPGVSTSPGTRAWRSPLFGAKSGIPQWDSGGVVHRRGRHDPVRLQPAYSVAGIQVRGVRAATANDSGVDRAS